VGFPGNIFSFYTVIETGLQLSAEMFYTELNSIFQKIQLQSSRFYRTESISAVSRL